MFGQVVWSVVVAVLLVAVAVGWAVRGALEVDGKLRPPSRRRRPAITVRPGSIRVLSGRRPIFATAFLLGLGLHFLARTMDRGLHVVAAMVLALAYAVLCAMATGFPVWVQAQRGTLQDATTRPRPYRWAAWVGAATGALAVSYLVVVVVGNLSP